MTQNTNFPDEIRDFVSKMIFIAEFVEVTSIEKHSNVDKLYKTDINLNPDHLSNSIHFRRFQNSKNIYRDLKTKSQELEGWYGQIVQLNIPSMNTQGNLTILFNSELRSWDYSWKSSRWSKSDSHAVEVSIFAPIGTLSEDYYLVERVRSSNFNIISSHKNTSISSMKRECVDNNSYQPTTKHQKNSEITQGNKFKDIQLKEAIDIEDDFDDRKNAAEVLMSMLEKQNKKFVEDNSIINDTDIINSDKYKYDVQRNISLLSLLQDQHLKKTWNK